MSIWKIIWRSLVQHRGSTLLAMASIASGIALLLAVGSLREQAHRHFVQSGTGVDAVLGPKGSPLQIALNACYHLEEMPGRIPWTYYQAVRANPLVADGFAFVSGHTWAGWRVNAVETRFFSDFQWAPGERFSCAPERGGQGRMCAGRSEAVVGADVARALGVHLGQAFNPTCGVSAGDPVHANDRIEIVGILAPTGTPHDRAVYIPLETFYTLDGHGAAVNVMANDLKHREISGAYLQLSRIRGGAYNPGVQEMQYEINQSAVAQLVLPAEVMPRLMGIIGWVDQVLWAVSALVTVLAAAFLAFVLVATLRERRRDLALLRALGAGRRTVFGLVMAQAVTVCLGGAALGWLAGHGLTAIGCHHIEAQTGLHFSAWYAATVDFALLPAAVVMGLVAGLVPAVQAYRLPLIDTLKHTT